MGPVYKVIKKFYAHKNLECLRVGRVKSEGYYFDVYESTNTFRASVFAILVPIGKNPRMRNIAIYDPGSVWKNTRLPHRNKRFEEHYESMRNKKELCK